MSALRAPAAWIIHLALLGNLAGPPAAAVDCAAPPPGAEPLLAPGGVVLVGEIHGTVESPRFVRDLACQALGRGLAVTLGLELPREEQGRLDAYLASAGGSAERAALLAGPFWRRHDQDGRSSAAMLELVEWARAARGEGSAVGVVAFDRTAPGPDRDVAMAERLAAALPAADAPALLLVLTGNYHNRLTPGAPWGAGWQPMGLLLARAAPGRPLVSLDVAHAGGRAWICATATAGGCGERRLTANGGGGAAGVELGAVADGAYSGRYHVGELTPSPPAVGAGPPNARAPELLMHERISVEDLGG